ncbi:MAG: response regulator [Marinilabiliaceae bacterium]|nr:response regulator [Marinilabiliaceae bacterium]
MRGVIENSFNSRNRILKLEGHFFQININQKALVFLILLMAVSHLSYSNNFIHLNAQIGNEEFHTNGVVQDSMGYLWLDSHSGLLKFDGYDFQLYTFIDIFGMPFSKTDIIGLKKGNNGTLYYAAKNGTVAQLTTSSNFKLIQYQSLTESRSLTTFKPGKSHIWFGTNTGTVIGKPFDGLCEHQFKTSIPNESIQSIAESENNLIWFSTDKGNVYNGDLRTGQLNKLSLPSNQSRGSIQIAIDPENNLWIGTKPYGLLYYNIKKNNFIQFHTQATALHRINSNMITCVYCDSKGLIWAGTDGGGLIRINPKTLQVKSYTHSPTNHLSLQTNTIIGISETEKNELWIFTNYGNINILSRRYTSVGYVSGSKLGTPTRILSVLKSKNGELWTGTDGEGLTRYNGEVAIAQYNAHTQTGHGLPGNYIQAMIEDQEGTLWIGTYQNGLAHYNPPQDRFYTFPLYNNQGIQATDIRSMFVDSRHRIWIGSNVGLFVISPLKKSIAHFPYNNRNGLNGSIAEVFIEDENQQLWIGLENGGLALLKEKNILSASSFQTFQLINSTNQRENSIRHGTTDGNGHLYLINYYNRLIKFDTKRKVAIAIEGFNNDQIHSSQSVIANDNNHLWIARTSGISHMNLITGKEQYFNWRNGIQKGTFLPASVTTDSDGTIYFGGIKGVNYFNPLQMSKSENYSNLYINRFELLNRDANEIIREQLTMGIEHLKEVNLNHDQSSFSFKFAVVDNFLDPHYFYAYRLKGFKDSWSITEDERIATYTNIPPGQYTFEVKAGTKRDLWDISPRKIIIHILPPLWQRWWAYLIYLFTILTIGAVAIYYSIVWANMKKNILKEKWLSEHNKELYDMKMNFFAKMSHEIQTPLTLILSPLNNMLERAEGNLLLQQRLQIIKNNAQRLSRIAKELMMVRTFEMEKLKLSASFNNLYSNVNDIVISFMEQARFNHIEFAFECSEKELIVWYDKEKMEHIIYNLLSNAFKYTPAEGLILLSIESLPDQKQIIIKVKDSGIGIPEDELNNIFELFYQASNGKSLDGTGIGLALCKELILLHEGTICVESHENIATTFTLTLPHDKVPEKTFERLSLPEVTSFPSSSHPVAVFQEETSSSTSKNHKKRTLLIVEDNHEMLQFLKDTFIHSYAILLAKNGKEALEQVTLHHPDIILSDVMMPVMDGIALCKELKENVLTRHIPILLLTARNATTTKIKGLKYGAIEYMNKPFNVNELFLKVNNIIEGQDQIIKQYRTELLSSAKEVEAESPDEIFINAVIEEVEKNYQNPDYRLEDLSPKLHMSYSNIYRKFHSLTGKKLVNFVRSFRLKKATILLIKYNYTISEIAFLVGFNDAKYFTKCFKSEFNKSPKQYREQADYSISPNLKEV